MTVRTTYTSSSVVSFEVNGKVIFQADLIPEEFGFSILGNSPLFVGRKKATFLSHRKYFIEDLTRKELASITINGWLMGWPGRTALELNGMSYRILPIRKKRFELLSSNRAWRIEGMGIECRMETSFLGCEIISTIQGKDDFEIALTLLLQYFELKLWQESN